MSRCSFFSPFYHRRSSTILWESVPSPFFFVSVNVHATQLFHSCHSVPTTIVPRNHCDEERLCASPYRILELSFPSHPCQLEIFLQEPRVCDWMISIRHNSISQSRFYCHKRGDSCTLKGNDIDICHRREMCWLQLQKNIDQQRRVHKFVISSETDDYVFLASRNGSCGICRPVDLSIKIPFQNVFFYDTIVLRLVASNTVRLPLNESLASNHVTRRVGWGS